jgi:general secretion pathway protein B
MSFILDALKKSEAERQRQAGPALLEMRVVRPRRRLPSWGIALGLLLGINMLVLLWLALRRPAAAPVAPPAATAGAAASAQPLASVAPQITSAPAAAAAPVNGPDALAEANPADLEPALPASGGSARVERDLQSVQNYADVAGTVPQLRLNLHVYASRASERYALINMRKVHEGDVLPEGARVVEITRDGVVLSYQGTEFLLGRE